MISSGTSLIRPPCAGRRAHAAPDRTPSVVYGGGPTDRYRRGCRSHAVPPARPVVATTQRGRIAAVAALVTVTVALVVGGITAGAGGERVSAGSPDNAGVAEVQVRARHVAGPGDTLWSIAHDYRGDVAHERFLDVLIDLNGGTAIEVGQAVWLP